MCGIVGQLGPAPADLQPALRALAPRGPDDEGVLQLVRGPLHVALGFRRLAILDLSPAGRQPMANEDETLWLVFNGEIYNFRLLRKELEAHGHRFSSQADSEVILHGYEQWGDGVLQRLRGMFALALWDERRERLLLARDRLGIKPLFVSQAGGRLSFGSEMKALLALGVPKALDPRALPVYLQRLHLPAPLTFFRDIRRVSPGEKLVWEKGALTSATWWDLALPPQHRDEATVVPQLRALLEETVREHLQADVPLGVFLSGGLDSSTLAALTARHATGRVRTYCMTFEPGAGLYDEREHAQAVADHIGSDHTEIPVQPDAALLLPEMVKGFDEPFGNPTALLSWLLSRETRKHVTVALAGDGGDEVFLGYPRYQGMRLAGWLSRVPRPLRAALSAGAPLIRESWAGRHGPRRAREFLQGAALPPEEMYARWVGTFDLAEAEALVAPHVLRAADLAGEPPPTVADWFARAPGGGLVDRAAYVDLKTFLPDNLLTYTDRMSMAHSLEVRVPFCDHRVVEFMASIDADQRHGPRESKRLLRRAVQDLLPPSILGRGKLGFNPPMGIWLRGPLQPLVDDLLSEARVRKDGLLAPAAVQALVRAQREGARDLSLHVFSLLAFQTWLDLYRPET